MSATPHSMLANPEQLIADLQRQLAKCKAELAECKAQRDEALEQQTATAEVLQVIQLLALRPRAGVRRDARKGDAAV